LLCVHTPADNLAADFLNKEIKKKKPETLADIVRLLKEIPEYKEAAKQKAVLRFLSGVLARARAGLY